MTDVADIIKRAPSAAEFFIKLGNAEWRLDGAWGDVAIAIVSAVFLFWCFVFGLLLRIGIRGDD